MPTQLGSYLLKWQSLIWNSQTLNVKWFVKWAAAIKKNPQSTCTVCTDGFIHRAFMDRARIMERMISGSKWKQLWEDRVWLGLCSSSPASVAYQLKSWNKCQFLFFKKCPWSISKSKSCSDFNPSFISVKILIKICFELFGQSCLQTDDACENSTSAFFPPWQR